MDKGEFRNELLSLLNSESKKIVDKEGALCTNFILIAEYVDSNNDYYTFVAKDESMPVWRHTGLIAHVLETEFTEEDE